MRSFTGSLGLVLALGCSGDKEAADDTVDVADTDTDTDADTDTDTDTDTDADTDTDTDTDTVGPGVWDLAFEHTGGALSGVWGSAPDDVFMVGGTDVQAEIYHFDGTEWAPMAVPADVPLMVWVYGFGPDDVTAVGLDGAALHYDGTEWTELETGTTEDLWGVFGFAPNDLWIVGGIPDITFEPVILHYDGKAFTPYALDPAENPRGATTLFKVWGIDDELFIVGQKGTIQTWDGSDWLYSSPGKGADQDWVALWGTAADNIVAVGGRGNGRVAVWDGALWATYQPPAVGGLSGVTMLDPDTAVVGGLNGYVGLFDVPSKTLLRETPATTLDVHALWNDGAGTTYGVAGRFLAPFDGAALIRTEE